MNHPFRPMMIAGAVFLAAATAVGFVGAARAETAPPLNLSLPAFTGAARPAPAVTLAGAPARPTPDIADPLDPQARPRLVVNPLSDAVFARTSVDRHLGGSEGGLTASAGFLCGRQQGGGDSGGAAAYGVDPHGRFVGAKLSFAF